MDSTRAVAGPPPWLAFANRPARAIGWILALDFFCIVAALALNGTAELGWRAVTRTTAQVAFALFLTVFLAAPISRLWPGPRTRALLVRRRALGLAFAAALLVHGLAILHLAARVSGTLSLDAATVGGGLGFVFAAAMAATSNEAARQALGGRAWRALHRGGLLLLFVIFAVTYAGRFAENPRYAPGVLLLALALALRVAASFRAASLRSRTLPIE